MKSIGAEAMGILNKKVVEEKHDYKEAKKKSLTAREVIEDNKDKVVEMAVKGHKYAEIAEELGIGDASLRAQAKLIFDKEILDRLRVNGRRRSNKKQNDKRQKELSWE